MNKLILILMVSLLGLIVIVDAQSQGKKMYSWTDENGTVHFSEVAPEGQAVQEQNIPQAEQSSASSPYPQAAAGPSPAEQKRQDIAQKHQEAQVNNAINSAECAAWQAEVDRLEPNRRVYFTNDQGETERMDDVERVNRVAQLKSNIASNCK